MTKRCNRCGKNLEKGEVLYCEECRQIVHQEYLEKQNTSNTLDTQTNKLKSINAPSTNRIGNALKIVGFIYIGVCIIYRLIIPGSDSVGYNLYDAIVSTFCASAFGLLISGIGEIILLLQANYDNLKSMLSIDKNNQ
ncbi:hypothetical protein [Aminipila terrae]|uniref:Uncharacterized protein n=1 Tax=Aminipila terrae TaxID=2697030 RepID=A0A6P1MPL2_9FIRM|nr:hypothetical protein [Aminipila terrae]QHI73606.1 hypothetical protein Ami3637_15585 [Aminipila terrae]